MVVCLLWNVQSKRIESFNSRSSSTDHLFLSNENSTLSGRKWRMKMIFNIMKTRSVWSLIELRWSLFSSEWRSLFRYQSAVFHCLSYPTSGSSHGIIDLSGGSSNISKISQWQIDFLQIIWVLLFCNITSANFVLLRESVCVSLQRTPSHQPSHLQHHPHPILMRRSRERVEKVTPSSFEDQTMLGRWMSSISLRSTPQMIVSVRIVPREGDRLLLANVHINMFLHSTLDLLALNHWK